MKCPECEESFPFTWARYMRAPLGRTSCPSCGARLVLKHRWFYWPAMVLGGALLCAPLAVLGYRLTGSMVVTMLAAGIGWLLSGVPADYYLEARFSLLKPVGKAKIKSGETDPEQEESVAEEPQEENA